MKETTEDKALNDVAHVELARETTSDTDVDNKAGKNVAVSTLPAIYEGKLDAAMEILHGERVEMTDEQSRMICRKIDKVILPILAWVYFLQILDKSVVGYGANFGMKTDANLVGTQYSLIGSSGYWAQLGWQPISALLIIKVPTRILMTWRLDNNPGVARFLTPEERRWAVERLRDNNTGVESSKSVIELDTDVNGKADVLFTETIKWKQIVEALISIPTWLIVSLVFCVKWCGSVGHVSSRATVQKVTSVDMRFLIQQRLWAFNYLRIRLYTPPYDPAEYPIRLCAGVRDLAGQLACGSLQNKEHFPRPATRPMHHWFWASIRPWSWAKVYWSPVIGLLVSPGDLRRKDDEADRTPFSLIGFLFGANPLIASWLTSNTAGYTKKSTVLAMYAVGNAVGNIVGPLLFKSTDAPLYREGLKAVLGIFIAAGGATAFIVASYIFLNRRKEKERVAHGKPAKLDDRSMKQSYEAGDAGDILGQNAFLDMTDKENDEVRCVQRQKRGTVC
ncbi:hypothetical protein QFC22_006103 [Naganishia vaughanmartiniae]|uniref:Uncharacterized protein n=1 Tax=Naganishia vaughanmartiniae TaxID=1424756 RepID=A0ACC2WPM1_9TREE|nr:hypothetical protein QFC22_006103 [Naganishia vaughanmartiniae]